MNHCNEIGTDKVDNGADVDHEAKNDEEEGKKKKYSEKDAACLLSIKYHMSFIVEAVSEDIADIICAKYRCDRHIFEAYQACEDEQKAKYLLVPLLKDLPERISVTIWHSYLPYLDGTEDDPIHLHDK